MSFARAIFCCLIAAIGLAADRDAVAQRPYRIYAITFRGMTDVERGFQEYFAARRIPVQITFRDLNRDPSRMPGFIEEIRATRPDLIYTWGTSVTLGVVGPFRRRRSRQAHHRHPGGVHPGRGPRAREDRARPEDLQAQRDRRLPRGADRRADPRDRVLPAVQVDRDALHADRAELGRGGRRDSRARTQAGLHRVAKPFRIDAAKKVTSDGAAEMIREMKDQKVEWLYLPPDSFLGTQAQKVIIPAAMQNQMPTFASTEQLVETGA
jgi:putative ABC transport system substrate-binding protein